jgi:hypothetical protein
VTAFSLRIFCSLDSRQMYCTPYEHAIQFHLSSIHDRTVQQANQTPSSKGLDSVSFFPRHYWYAADTAAAISRTHRTFVLRTRDGGLNGSSAARGDIPPRDRQICLGPSNQPVQCRNRWDGHGDHTLCQWSPNTEESVPLGRLFGRHMGQGMVGLPYPIQPILVFRRTNKPLSFALEQTGNQTFCLGAGR